MRLFDVQPLLQVLECNSLRVDYVNAVVHAGWWGLARHFHYLPELVGAFCWTVPALARQCLPYFYVVFLTLLLTDRAFRDDMRCASKYGKFWTQYTKSVPYKMVPYVF